MCSGEPERLALQRSERRQRADLQPAIGVERDSAHLPHRLQVDQPRWSGEARLHQREQICAPRDKLGATVGQCKLRHCVISARS